MFLRILIYGWVVCVNLLVGWLFCIYKVLGLIFSFLWVWWDICDFNILDRGRRSVNLKLFLII